MSNKPPRKPLRSFTTELQRYNCESHSREHVEKLSRNRFRIAETTRVLDIVRAQRTHLKTCPYCGFQTEYMPEMEFHLDDTTRSWLWTYRCPFMPTNTQKIFLTNLPPEILVHIMSLAGEATRRSLRRTSKLMVEIYRIVVKRKVRNLIATGTSPFQPCRRDWMARSLLPNIIRLIPCNKLTYERTENSEKFLWCHECICDEQAQWNAVDFTIYTRHVHISGRHLLPY